jgi:hypothetical protein
MTLPSSYIKRCEKEGYRELLTKEGTYNYFEKCPIGQ